MASLNGQTIASSYEQLLHVDRDGGGNANTLVSVKDGDNGTTFGIKLATNKVEIIPGSNDTNAFEVSQADGTAVLTVDSTNALVGVGAAPASGTADPLQITTPASGGGQGLSILRTDNNASQLIGRITAGNSVDAELASITFNTDGANDSGNIIFNTEATGGSLAESLKILSSGRVIIPQGTLEVGEHGVAGGQLVSDGDLTYNSAFNDSSGDNGDHVFKVHSGGTELVRFNHDGKVGINSSSPDEELEIFSSSGGNDVGIKLRALGTSSTAESHVPAISFQSDQGDGVTARASISADRDGGATKGALIFKTRISDNITEAMRIDSSGQVGIGCAPTGQLHIRTTTSGSADETLTLDTSQSSVGSGSIIRFSGNNRGHVGADIKAVIQASSTEKTSLIFDINDGTGTAEAMRLDHTRNVGINKNGPLTKLHVVGATGNPATSGTAPTAIARFDSTYNSVLDIGQGADPYPIWIQGADRSNLSQTYHINMQPNGGNVGIGNFSDGTVHTGTTPDQRLQVVKYGVSVDTTIHKLQKWSTGFSGSEKGSNFGIGLSRYQDPGNNFPRTKATFFTTGRTTDDDTLASAVMSINDSGNFVTSGTHQASGSPDYAEYFESKDGKAIPFGTSVKLDGDKVVPCESGDTPIGVISADPSVIAGGAEFEWKKRWLVDDYGKKLIGENGNEIENPDYDDSIEYIPRGDREEWNVVGIMGQLPVTKGQPVASNWIKMKDISDTVELWFVK